MNRWLLMLIMLAVPVTLQAANEPYETFGEYKVFYTVFNSSFIKPDIARTYNITRGKRHVLVNISLIKSGPEGDSEGLAAEVKGTAANLMQQQKTLKFQEIKEQEAVYYLAPLRITDEEVMNFKIDVTATPGARPFTLEFTKTLYVDS